MINPKKLYKESKERIKKASLIKTLDGIRKDVDREINGILSSESIKKEVKDSARKVQKIVKSLIDKKSRKL